MTRAVRFQGPGPGIRIGRLEDDAVWDAGAAPAVGFAPTAEAWERVRGASGACFRLDQVTLLAPVVPPKLICIGLNYRLHAEETGAAIPTEPVRLLQAAELLQRPRRRDRAAEGRRRAPTTRPRWRS